MLPEGWSNGVLRDFVVFLDHMRRPVKSGDRATRAGSFPYYGASGVIDWVDDYLFDEPLLLIGEDGENILSRNLPLIFPVDGKVWVNNHAHVLRCRENICREYLCDYLNTLDFAPLNTGTAQPKLNKKSVENLLVRLPPLPEQKKIAEILSTWDAAIETTDKLLANAEAQKRALMHQLLTGKRRLKGFEGREWKLTALKATGQIVGGGTPDSDDETAWDGHVNWATPTEITGLDGRYIGATSRRITTEGLRSSAAKLLPKGSLLVCTRATIGQMAIAAEAICTNQGFKSIVPNDRHDVEFLFHLLAYFKNSLIRWACGSTFLELSKSDFEKLTFLMPERDEQQRIAEAINSIDDQRSLIAAEIGALKHMKKALMQQLLTGKRRVTI
jgi:type I restriction enzyme, S subunit